MCLFACNVVLLLLESHLRKHVHRAFQLATAFQDELERPLVALWAHLETAKGSLYGNTVTTNAQGGAVFNKAIDLLELNAPTEGPASTIEDFLLTLLKGLMHPIYDFGLQKSCWANASPLLDSLASMEDPAHWNAMP
ncbi:hypothetical protein H310_00293 [Aphanomyces invadans]|uniref:Uncharacterized protein n=1 Tax=Aphanomyces invadans TaxID=157072 RepID=A0A024UW10_9STRA|nr:hypothetical protein H310_00293 [Aphanomyces invadans]ETW09833.1 hypothetical protein H310_00293 [Aphanomyces invadans]|eukprot:XP_008861244.1 hypothetical protein H310_00293 [Aphanomyces invadans]